MFKKCMFVVLAILIGATAFGQSYSKVSSDTFKAEKTVRASKPSSYQPTGKYYIDTDSAKYEIHIHTVTKGKNAGQTFCYIQKVSKKTGKSYWKKIDIKVEELK